MKRPRRAFVAPFVALVAALVVYSLPVGAGTNDAGAQFTVRDRFGGADVTCSAITSGDLVSYGGVTWANGNSVTRSLGNTDGAEVLNVVMDRHADLTAGGKVMAALTAKPVVRGGDDASAILAGFLAETPTVPAGTTAERYAFVARDDGTDAWDAAFVALNSDAALSSVRTTAGAGYTSYVAGGNAVTSGAGGNASLYGGAPAGGGAPGELTGHTQTAPDALVELFRANQTGFAVGSTTGVLSPSARLHAVSDDATNAGTTDLLRLEHTTTGTPGAGIGAGIEFFAEDDLAAVVECARVEGLLRAETGGTNNRGSWVASVLSSGGAMQARIRAGAAGVRIGGVGSTDPSAILEVNQFATAGNPNPLASFIGGAHTGLNVGSEWSDVVWSLNRTVQFTTGTTLATQRAVRVHPPTYTATTATHTITDATLFSLVGPPVAGANLTITNPLTFRVEAGNSRFGGSVYMDGQAGDPAAPAADNGAFFVRADRPAFRGDSGSAQGLAFVDPAMAGGRLTASSTAAVTTVDTTSATLYYLPYVSTKVALYNTTTTRWDSYDLASSGVSFDASTLTADQVYDAFLFDSSGTLTLDLVAWSNHGAGTGVRATALAAQDGAWVKTGALGRRYVGTVRTVTSAGVKVTDTAAKRYVWNVQNRMPRALVSPAETTDSWTYTTAAFRQANASGTNQAEVVVGISDASIVAHVHASAAHSAGTPFVAVGVGIDSTTVNSAQVLGFGTNPGSGSATYRGALGIGYHQIVWLEYGVGSGATTWYGDNGTPTSLQSGLVGEVLQ